MPHRFPTIATVCSDLARAATILVVLATAMPVRAEDGQPYRMQWPLPKAALEHEPESPPDVVAVTGSVDPQTETDAALFAPGPMAQADPAAIALRSSAALRHPIPVKVIREGLSPAGTAPGRAPDRAVGLKLGADIFAVSTKLQASAVDGRGADARIEWLLARPVTNAGPGFIWSVATGGSGASTSSPEQNANLLLGYRHALMEHLMLTSQLSMVGNYVFTPGDRGHSALVPEFKISADLGALAGLPWETSLDLSLARQMPMMSSVYETRGTAMLRLKHSLE